MNSTLSIITESISERTGIPNDKAKTIISEFLDIIMTSISADERIVLRGFGSFYAKRKKGRKYRDIRTGEIKISKPGTTPAFQPSRVLLREMMKGGAKKDKKKNGYDQSPHTVIIPKKPKQPEACEIIVSTPNPRQTDNLRIQFTPNDKFDSADVYPIVYSPAPNAYLKLPRNGRSNVRGYKELDFLAEIGREFTDISVSDDLHLKIPGRYAPYEPDIVLYDESINLYIDVEIDEPYDGYSRLVTHILEGRDTVRDIFFKESGWVVVRFTEKQVHLSCPQCIRTLRNIVDTMRGQAKPSFTIIEKEPRWNRRQAILWEKELYREKYLGIQFFAKQVRTRKIECRDAEEGIDLVIKRTPDHLPVIADVHSPLPKRETRGSDTVIPLSQAHPPVLTFNDSSHTYASPGDHTGNTDRISVTTLIELFFPYFDEEAYIQKRMEETGMSEEAVRRELAEPSERGTDMHKQIENFLKGLPYDESSKEFQLFLKFHQEQIVKRGLVFDSAEYAIELKGSNIAGTVDALFRKPNGEYVMVDWKRSKHLIIDGYPKKYGFGRGLSVLSHLDNSSYYKYEIQQSFYKYILEKDYGITVSSMILAVLYPDYDRYYSIKLSDYRKQEVLDMIESYENTL